jgi:ribosome-interacting GTPase 1
VYTSCIYVMNKIDQISIEELDLIYKVPHAGIIPIIPLIQSLSQRIMAGISMNYSRKCGNI